MPARLPLFELASHGTNDGLISFLKRLSNNVKTGGMLVPAGSRAIRPSGYSHRLLCSHASRPFGYLHDLFGAEARREANITCMIRTHAKLKAHPRAISSEAGGCVRQENHPAVRPPVRASACLASSLLPVPRSSTIEHLPRPLPASHPRSACGKPAASRVASSADR